MPSNKLNGFIHILLPRVTHTHPTVVSEGTQTDPETSPASNTAQRIAAISQETILPTPTFLNSQRRSRRFCPYSRSTTQARPTLPSIEECLTNIIHLGLDDKWDDVKKTFVTLLRLNITFDINSLSITSYSTYFQKNYYLCWGLVFFDLDLTEKALGALQKAFNLDQNDCDIHYILGKCFERQEKFQQAVDQYKEAIRILMQSNNEVKKIRDGSLWEYRLETTLEKSACYAMAALASCSKPH
jgi:tetratricopeptide (TPR) repeat protein